MTPDQIRQLAHKGARIRLDELNAEAQQLQSFIHDDTNPTASTDDEPTPAKPHWTQRPENRAKLLTMAKKASRTRRRNTHDRGY